jgi:hypothetical protein
MGFLQDLSDGGIGVLLDGGTFVRGTELTLQLNDDLKLTVWVCHAVMNQDGCRLGLSFAPCATLEPDECPTLVGNGCFAQWAQAE